MNNQLITENYYSTSDLSLATSISLFYPLDSIDKKNPYKAEFLFKRDDSLDKLIEAYWKRELKIEPQAFFAQLKFIKSRLYSQ